MKDLTTPISEEDIASLQVGDTVTISGYILCGRDAVLPKVGKMIEEGRAGELGADIKGQVIRVQTPHRNMFAANDTCYLKFPSPMWYEREDEKAAAERAKRMLI